MSRGLQYVRFQLSRELLYQSWDHYTLDAREMRQILALIDHHVKARFKPIALA